MNNKVGQFSATSPNPVLRTDENGTVLFSNKAGETLLNEWGVGVGEKLPLSIRNIVQRVISRNNPEKTGVIVGKRVYLTVFHPLFEEKSVCISGFDIEDQKEFKEKVQDSNTQEIADVEIAEIIDIKAVQSLMDEFYKLTHIPIGLNDLKGNELVCVGWQDICIKFHRVHPEACKHCIESDTMLSRSVVPGEFQLYKCKNNLWDIATPIMAGSTQVGLVFSGQFFFDDEPLDYELFRSQARRYGFNEEEYIEALEKVPRLSRETVETGTSYLMKLANMLSQLSISNIRMAQSLVEHDALVDALKEREKIERIRSEELEVVLDAVPAAVLLTHDPHALKITGNRLSYEWLRLPMGVNLSMSAPEGERPETFKLFKNGMEIPPEDLPMRLAASGKELHDYEFDIVHQIDTPRHLLGNVRPLYDDQDNIRGSVAAFIDITERKKAEEALKKAHDSLEEKVKERTADLETAFNSLKKIETNLAEAQKIAHIGSWEWDIVADKVYLSDEMYRIFGHSPEDAAPAFNELLNYIYPDDLNYVTNAFKEGPRKGPYFVDFKIILATGEERSIHMQSVSIFKEGIPVLMKGTVQDITEIKRSEEKLRESEEKYRNIVETSNEGIVIIDNESKITFANKRMADMLGYTLEENSGRPIWDFLIEESKAIIQLNLKNSQPGIDNSYELKLMKKDGSILWALINAKSLFDKDREFVGSMCMITDITKRKEAEQALVNFEIAREKEMHHRIKDNLQVVSSLFDLQAYKFIGRNDIKDSEVLDAFKESQSRVTSITFVHDELYKGGLETVNISEYVERLANNLLSIYRRGNIDICLNKDVVGDLLLDMETAVPLGVIINELVSNSFKFAFLDRDKGEIRIKLHRVEGKFINVREECECEGPERTNLILTVSDNGVGIPENLDLENIDSLGLQLVTCQVVQLDGELEIKRNNGTEFTIRFTVKEKKNKNSLSVQNKYSEPHKFLH